MTQGATVAMPVPDYQSLMLPFLRLISDGRQYTIKESREQLADQLGLSQDDLAQMLPSGKQALFSNRLGWAKTYLLKAGLLTQPARSVVQISERGKATLVSGVNRIDKEYLKQFEGFEDFLASSDLAALEVPAVQPATTPFIAPSQEARQETPEEVFEAAYSQLRTELETDLLDHVKTASPAFFERLVVDLLVKMGYGGSRADAGEAIGRSGDGGIDGIIKEDRLGLDAIYIQAKRWQNTVGRPEIQGFAGSLHGVRARKGVFITTSQFSSEARQYVSNIELKIVLIDGKTLARLMVDYGVGVSTVASYEVKRIDNDYFDEA